MAATDESLENLKAFNAALAAAIDALERDTGTLQNGLGGFESVQTAWRDVADAESSGAFTATLHDLDETLDEDVEAVTSATAAVKALATERQTDDLPAAKASADAEAEAWATAAEEASRRTHDAAVALDIGAVALSDQAVYVGVALGRLEAGATAAFKSVGEAAAEIGSALTAALERAAEEAREYATSLEPSMHSFDDALEAFESTVGAATTQLERAHESGAEALRGSYEEWEEMAKKTATRVQGDLTGELAELATMLEARTAGVTTDEDAVALNRALQRVSEEQTRWRDRIEDRREFLAGLPGLAADLKNAYVIATTVVGVLDAL